MPKTEVIFYAEADGTSPVLEFLKDLRHRNEKAYANCQVKIERLAELGHELRRPEADLLRNGIYELRAKQGRVNYRILYFFSGRNIAILGHALTKEDTVPNRDIAKAIERKKNYEGDPKAHTYVEPEGVDHDDDDEEDQGQSQEQK